MRCKLLCPVCGAHTIDFNTYTSMVVLAPNLALMQFDCPQCKMILSATVKLTPEMQREIQQKISLDTIERKDAPESFVLSGENGAQVVPDPSKLSYAAALIIEETNPEIEPINPLRSCAIDTQTALDDFKQRIETIETVDEVIEEIDTGFHQNRRDS